MTTPLERPSTEIRALVDGYSEALEAWHTAEAGDEAGALYPAIEVARQALLAALGALEEDKQVYADIKAERARQDAQWGGSEHDDQHTRGDWDGFRGAFENHARYSSHPEPRRKNLIRIAALCVAEIESMDRHTPIDTAMNAEETA